MTRCDNDTLSQWHVVTLATTKNADKEKCWPRKKSFNWKNVGRGKNLDLRRRKIDQHYFWLKFCFTKKKLLTGKVVYNK